MQSSLPFVGQPCLCFDKGHDEQVATQMQDQCEGDAAEDQHFSPSEEFDTCPEVTRKQLVGVTCVDLS